MGANTSIEWTDATWNPWLGCVEYHEGCKNCYARELVERFGKAKWGREGPRALTSPATWAIPKKLQRQAEKTGKTVLCFTASLSDFFENYSGKFVNHSGDPIPESIEELRAKAFALIDQCPGVVFQLLTKRAAHWADCWPYANKALRVRRKLSNAWVGVSASTQSSYDDIQNSFDRISEFAAGAFLSLEPLLGPIDFLKPEWWCWRCHLHVPVDRRTALARCHLCADPVLARAPIRDVGWVIVGGESGRSARPNNVRWTREIISQCRELGIPVFHKQLGSNAICGGDHAEKTGPVQRLQLRSSKGGDASEWDADLRVQEFPKGWSR